MSLPIAKPRGRKTSMGRRRALVLLGVHLLIALHVTHWLSTGSTLTPLEPSEAMQFSKNLVINAGLIFFALTILSTLMLGRWFCGWGCHLVALQDLSRWILGRFGIVLQPLRSRLLGLVPLLALVYMFVAPFVYQALGEGRPAHGLSLVLSTDDFWATFPGWIPATLTFITCGGIAVFLLGAKGFCTYGCPYGAAFGVADQFAPLRILVNDDCTRTGHCTTVCSSNVRVAKEVGEFGMVVDPGCMKCLDCVSACPNEALRFGRGKPALFAQAERGSIKHGSVRVRRPWLRHLLTMSFGVAALVLFVGFDRAFAWTRNDVIVAAVLAGVAWAAAAIFAGRTAESRESDLLEEFVLGMLFLTGLAVFRGLYGLVAFLFALGLAGIVAGLGVETLRLFMHKNVVLAGFRLKHEGRLHTSGAMLIGAMVLFAVLGIHSGYVQYHGFAARRILRSLATVRPAGVSSNIAANSISSDALVRALHDLRIVEDWSLATQPQCVIDRVRLLRRAGRMADEEKELVAGADRYLHDSDIRFELAGLRMRQGRLEDAAGLYEDCIRLKPRGIEAYANLGFVCTALHRFDEAERVLTDGLSRAPHNPNMLQNLGICYAERGDMPAAVKAFTRAMEAAPESTEIRITLGLALSQLGELDQAVAQLQKAVELSPDSPTAHRGLADVLNRLGDEGGARSHDDIARRLEGTAEP